MQALLIAAQALRIRLEGLGRQFTWLGGEPGDTGIQRTIPFGFGLAFSKRAEKLIEQEATTFVRARMRARRAAKRLRASPRKKTGG